MPVLVIGSGLEMRKNNVSRKNPKFLASKLEGRWCHLLRCKILRTKDFRKDHEFHFGHVAFEVFLRITGKCQPARYMVWGWRHNLEL